MARDEGSSLLYFLIGGTVGAVAALLLAPRTGKETRARLGEWLEERREKGEELLAKIKEKVPEKEQVAAAVRAGKDAFREARHNHIEA